MKKKEILESSNKIYLRNAKAQTIPDKKLIARRWKKQNSNIIY